MYDQVSTLSITTVFLHDTFIQIRAAFTYIVSIVGTLLMGIKSIKLLIC